MCRDFLATSATDSVWGLEARCGDLDRGCKRQRDDASGGSSTTYRRGSLVLAHTLLVQSASFRLTLPEAEKYDADRMCERWFQPSLVSTGADVTSFSWYIDVDHCERDVCGSDGVKED